MENHDSRLALTGEERNVLAMALDVNAAMIRGYLEGMERGTKADRETNAFTIGANTRLLAVLDRLRKRVTP